MSKIQSVTLAKPQLATALLWMQQKQHLASSAVTVLSLSGCAWLAGSLVWLPVSEVSITPWRAQISDISSSSSSLRVDVADIKKRQLFGQYQSTAPVVAKSVAINAPQTRLSITLVGIVAVNPANKSLATVVNRGKQATYAIGETIEGTRAHIVAISHDRIVINNAGRDETLMLKNVKYSQVNTTPVTSSSSQSRSAHVNYDEASSNEEALAKIKQEVAQDPTLLFQYVRLSLTQREGKTIGYTLSPGRSAALFESVGLERGDIATQINGVDLTEASAMSKLMAMMTELTEVNLTVERDGQPYEIYIQF